MFVGPVILILYTNIFGEERCQKGQGDKGFITGEEVVKRERLKWKIYRVHINITAKNEGKTAQLKANFKHKIERI